MREPVTIISAPSEAASLAVVCAQLLTGRAISVKEAKDEVARTTVWTENFKAMIFLRITPRMPKTNVKT
jgi:hypothetical protein